jgi:hypothetical protein
MVGDENALQVEQAEQKDAVEDVTAQQDEHSSDEHALQREDWRGPSCRCDTGHLKVFRRIVGSWRGSATQYDPSGRVVRSYSVEGANRLMCDSFYLLFIFTNPDGTQRRLEFIAPYSRKKNWFVADAPSLKGHAREVDDVILVIFEDPTRPERNSNRETLTVMENYRVRTIQHYVAGRYVGYTVAYEERGLEPVSRR